MEIRIQTLYTRQQTAVLTKSNGRRQRVVVVNSNIYNICVAANYFCEHKETLWENLLSRRTQHDSRSNSGNSYKSWRLQPYFEKSFCMF